MAFWLFVSLVIAAFALRRALRAEQVLSEQRRELVELRRMVHRLADRLGERWPASSTTSAPGGDAALAGAPTGSAYDAATAGAGGAPDRAAAAAAANSVDGTAAPGGAAAGLAGAATAGDTTGPFGDGAIPPLPGTTEGVPPVAEQGTPGAPAWRAAIAGSAGPPVASAPLPPLPARALRRTAQDADALENRIGGRWLLYIGISAIVLGASYFLKYAFDNEWIGEHTRVIVGVVSGVALTILGQRFVRGGHALYGQVLCGGGFGIIYLSIFAGHRWYDIIGSPLAFAGMVLTTAAAAWLADRQRSQPLALLAVTVGFLTPFLLGFLTGDSDSGHVTLFTYDVILVAGTLFLARRRASTPTDTVRPLGTPAWPALNLVSYVLTVMTIVLWADRAYRPALYVSVELFLTIFLVLFLAMLRENRRTQTPAALLATMLLALAPVLYHFASLVILRPHLGPLFVYLILFSVAGIIAAGQLRMPWIRVLVFIGVAVPFMGLVDRGFSRGWQAAAWATTIAVYGAHLLAQIDTLDERRDRLAAPEILLLHGNGLWLLFCLQALIAPRALAWSAPVALALAGWYGLLAIAARTRHREATLHATALASALVAIASTIYFDGPSLVVALAAEGAVLVALALRSSRLWLRAWGGLLLFIALIRALALLTVAAPIGYWPLLNPRTLSCLFIVGILYALALLHARAEAAATAAASAGRAARTDGPSGTPTDAGPTGAAAAGSPETAAAAAAIPALEAAAWVGAQPSSEVSTAPAATEAVVAGPTLTPAPAPAPPTGFTRHVLILAANVLTLVILTAEIVTYFDRRAWVGGVERVAGAAADAELSRQLTLSIVWALYAVALIAIGIWRNYRPVRYLAMLLFAFTILKVFLVDLATLDRVYRMLSVMALGVLLLIASYLYQRLRSADAPADPPAPAPAPAPDAAPPPAAPDAEHPSP